MRAKQVLQCPSATPLHPSFPANMKKRFAEQQQSGRVSGHSKVLDFDAFVGPDNGSHVPLVRLFSTSELDALLQGTADLAVVDLRCHETL